MYFIIICYRIFQKSFYFARCAGTQYRLTHMLFTMSEIEKVNFSTITIPQLHMVHYSDIYIILKFILYFITDCKSKTFLTIFHGFVWGADRRVVGIVYFFFSVFNRYTVHSYSSDDTHRTHIIPCTGQTSRSPATRNVLCFYWDSNDSHNTQF